MNIQVLVRDWNVKYDSKVMVSVVTTLIILYPPTVTKLQRNPDLLPIQWLHKDNARDVSHLYKLEEIDNLFRLEITQFIADLLFKSVMEQRHNHGNVKDAIDMETEKTRIVPFDNNNIIMFEKNEMDPYISVKPQSEGKRDITVLDRIDLNPCSYESVSKFINLIQKESNRLKCYMM